MKVPVETVVVTNTGDFDVVLTRIESLLAPEDGVSLTTSPSDFTLSPGETYFFVSGLTPSDRTDGRFDWTTATACDGTPGAGYLVKGTFSVDSQNRSFKILCDRARGAGTAEAASETERRKGKQYDQQQKKKKR